MVARYLHIILLKFLSIFCQVSGIFNEAKYVTPNLGDLPGALKARLGDSNKNLVGKLISMSFPNTS